MIPVDKLVKAGVNVAGVIDERFLNAFSEAHFTHNPSVYLGRAEIDQFEDLITVDYYIKQPIEFDLNPISVARFRRIWVRHLVTKGGDATRVARAGIIPGNLGLLASHVEFVVTVYNGHDVNSPRFDVTFDWALRARAAVVLKDVGQGRRAVTLEPVKVAFEKGVKVIQNDIMHSLRAGSAGGTSISKGRSFSSADEEWCLKVEQLILMILNSILQTQMMNFVRAWELPRAIELFDGVELQPDFLLVEGDLLIVGGQVVSLPTGVSPLQAELSAYVANFRKLYVEEFESRTPDEIAAWRPESSSTLRWLTDTRNELEASVAKKYELGQSSSARAINPSIFLLTDATLVDLLAKKYLSFSDGWSGSVQLDRIVKGEVGWWFRVDGAIGSIVPNGIAVHANVVIGGKAQVCHFSFDPKNFGGWQCYGPCVELSAEPDFGMNAYPLFLRDGIYLNVLLTTRGIGVRYCDWPDWANDILVWATTMLTRPLLDNLRAIIALFYIRVLKYPLHFPGTGLEWQPNISVRPTNLDRYLVFQAEPAFQ